MLGANLPLNMPSEKDLEMVTTLFENNTNGIPEWTGFGDADGTTSNGFYYLFLRLTKHKAEPEPFLQILQVDQKIGWTNPAHVETLVFQYKAMKIIADEQVSDRIFVQKGTEYFSKNNFRTGANGVSFGTLV